MADLVQLYNDRLRKLGEDDKVHSSRLKEKILSQIPNLSAHTSVHSRGQNIIIMFDRDVADLVQEERMNRDYDVDAMYLDWSFSPDGQTNVIHTSLKALVDMILQGPSIKNQSAKTTTDQPALTISQMFMFNAVKHARTKCSNLLNVDFYSKWVCVKALQETRSIDVIRVLEKQFVDFGCPQRLISDSGPQYGSFEFREFAKRMNFEHVTSSPNYARSNGLSERSVQTVKNSLIKMLLDGKTLADSHCTAQYSCGRWLAITCCVITG